MFYRIKALSGAGIKIKLHIFYKDFPSLETLIQYCEIIYLYKRKPVWKFKNLHTPLFVQSRRDDELVRLIAQDDDPILFEGIHTAYSIGDTRWAHKKKYIRMMNDESEYYYHLYKIEDNAIPKLYFLLESRLCRTFQSGIFKKVDHVFAISSEEQKLLNTQNCESTWIPPFFDSTDLSKTGSGDYLLYHGDLSIKENADAANFLIKEIIPHTKFKLIIAGNNPGNKLTNIATSNIQLVNSPDQDQMNQLISDAHIILLPFSQATGYKIKLLQSLAKGRHIITSDIIQSFTELSGLIQFAGTVNGWIEKINELTNRPFTEEDRMSRKMIMEKYFNQEKNAQKIKQIIFN